MKKLLSLLLVLLLVVGSVTTADAKIEYYKPLHIIKFVESKGYSFDVPDFSQRFENFEKGYIINGKKVTWTDAYGYLRGIAHSYDNLTKASNSNAFNKAFNKDFDSLAMMYYDYGVEFADTKEAFIEAFMVYCLNEDVFKQECPNIYKYLTDNVMKLFDDVSRSAWYRPYVEEAYNLGLMIGATETLFKPNANMTRGMVAIVFHRMEGSKKVSYSNVFKDVPNNQYYTTSVLWAKQKGVINGYTDGTFKPLRNVTREEMATMIYNFAKYKGLNVKSSKDISKFKDYNKITPYARGPLQWAVAKGIISGKDNGTRLDPKGTATRAECSKMLVQAYKLIY